jgi:hypothetical protein
LTYLGFVTEGKLATIFFTPSLGVPNWPVIYITNYTPTVFWHHSTPHHQNPREGKLMRLHDDGRNKNEMLRHLVDAVQWRNIDRKYYKTFVNEPRNVRFGLSMNGMNLFGNMSSKNSI